MEHDLRSLQVFIEGEFKASRQEQARMHTENTAANLALVTEMAKTTAQTTATNGRVTKMEITVAVLKFAVFTIGGSLLLAAMQVMIGRLGGIH